MEWSDVATHLTGFAHIATATPDGDPHVAVVWPIVDGETIWVFTRASSAKARRIATNGRIALMWRPGAEAYVHGSAELVHDLSVKEQLWARTDLPFDPSRFFGTVDDPDHVLIKVTPDRAVVMTHDGQGLRRLTWAR